MSTGSVTGFVVIGAVIGLFAGCHEPSPPPPAAPEEEVIEPFHPTEIPEPVRRPRRAERVVVGRSVQDRDILCHIHGTTGPVVLIIGGIHGNESASAMLARELTDYLDEHPDVATDRRILIIPEANPDGLDRGTRHNARGIDVNRNFPADNWRATRHNGDEPLSEPESRAIFDLLDRYRPDRVVSIHQPLAVVDYDGPAERLARAMAGRCGLPVKRLGNRPGSLGSYVGVTMNTPIVTYELPRYEERLSTGERWERYGPALLQAIEGAGDVTAASSPSPPRAEQTR